MYKATQHHNPKLANYSQKARSFLTAPKESALKDTRC